MPGRRRRDTFRAGFGLRLCRSLGFPARLLRPLERFLRVLERLLRKLVPGQVISLAVADGSRAVRVCGHFVKFSSSLVRVIRHWLSRESYRVGRRYRSTRPRIKTEMCLQLNQPFFHKVSFRS